MNMLGFCLLRGGLVATEFQRNLSRRLLTNYPVDLNEELLDRAIGRCARPVDCRRVRFNTGKRNLWRIWHIHAEDAYQFGNWFP